MAKTNEISFDERLSIIEQRLDELQCAKEVFTLDEASEFLGLSKSQLYKMTRTFAIPHYKPNGKCIYFDRAELVAWVKRNRVKTREEHEQAAAAYVAGKPLKILQTKSTQQ